MGKRQHQKDKMYLTATEWATLYGGKKPVARSGDQAEFRRLPLTHCALSLQPFEHPYCDDEGHVFDLMSIVPFLKKFKVNPITGKPLDSKNLIKLNFHKNADGKYHCPVLFKVFNNNSHIVAIKSTGNVFSNEAIEELNLKAKNFKDLITDEPFARTDLIVLQDPANLQKFNFANFHHLKNSLKIEDEEYERSKGDPTARLKTVNVETKEILDELAREYKPAEKATVQKKECDKFNAAHYSTGAVAASFTSTVMPIETAHEPAILEEEEVRYSRIKKKGYVRLLTNLGPLNLELHCDYTPKTCENFIKLCQKGYYDKTKFHRSIRNFMIQGGDPTGKGYGGESFWGKPFNDEKKPHLTHTGRGILSMANSGPNTNKSQFFITYRSCKHLDGKHTVFGRLVGGMETLSAMEKIEVDNKDTPIEDIIIRKAQVFVDPYEEVDEQLAADRDAEKERLAEEAEAAKKLSVKRNADGQLKVFRSGIGKYIDVGALSEPGASSSGPQKKKNVGYAFSNFSSW